MKAPVLPVRLRRRGANPYPEASITDALAALPPETGPQPVFTPRDPARPTAQQPALPVNGRPRPVRVASKDPAALARAAQALRDLDWEAVHAARAREGATYAAERAARGPVPFHDQVLLAGRPQRERPPVAEAARRHLASLAYPPCDGTGTGGAYAALMRRVSEITGTAGLEPGRLPLPAIDGGAR